MSNDASNTNTEKMYGVPVEYTPLVPNPAADLSIPAAAGTVVSLAQPKKVAAGEESGHEENAHNPSQREHNHQTVPDPHGWGSGLCDFPDDGANCCDVLVCGRCVLAQQYNLVAHNQRGIHWPFCMGLFLTDVFLAGGFAMLGAVWYVRREVRRRYDIESYVERSEWDPRTRTMRTVLSRESGNDCWEDVCAALFCTGCVLCQNHREMTARGDWPGKCLFGSNPAPDAVVML